jgi:hypothetical protein
MAMVETTMGNHPVLNADSMMIGIDSAQATEQMTIEPAQTALVMT